MSNIPVWPDDTTKTSANEDLKTYTRTNNLYSNAIALDLKYTEGVRDLAKTFSCYWLIESIAFLQKEIQEQKTAVFVLERTQKDSASFILTVEDANNNVLETRIIPESDFPYDLVKVYVIDSVMLLPSEYLTVNL